ncbi:MAG: tRNA (adenosine(37)-N6)-threonylcarbamoyltransferase complex dimerization subunit type 1 TsaB [Candidatus Saganbacteria bacterium]|nr:tRNA (adenosine(37)-N6)-threonylcarbamoyltransferase complex dimerization subunit type 1 TsaB [Candidatus Saganbacteria bacterium]
MKILGLSGATKVISLGLIDEETLLAETTVADGRAEKIMFYVKEAGLEPAQIDGIAVAAGPGSYSGLRGSLAAAKTLAQTLNVPLAGVSTLEAVAYNLIDLEGTVMAVLDARGDEYNCALFGSSGGRLTRLTDDLVMKLAVLQARLSGISGEIWLAGKTGELRAIKRDNLHFAADIHGQPYGLNVARLGREKFKAGKTDDPLKLAPVYSHQPNFREFEK